MTRSKVLRGLPVPRSRAKLRSRLDNKHQHDEEDPHLELKSFIQGWLPDEDEADLVTYASLDLTAYVKKTAHLDLPAGERLRLLAVYLDDESLVIGYGGGKQQWESLKRIYSQATKLEPDNPWVWNSRAVSALELADIADDEPTINALRHEALLSQRTALDMCPNEGHMFYTLGQVLYRSLDGSLQEALDAFERASELDPGDDWAKLYQAHCLHDLRRWQEAAVAYQAVNKGAFAGPKAWRGELLREQHAYCLMRAGDLQHALESFEDVIARRERAFDRGDDALDSPVLCRPPWLLVRAARGELHEQLYERARALASRYDVPALLDRLAEPPNR